MRDELALGGVGKAGSGGARGQRRRGGRSKGGGGSARGGGTARGALGELVGHHIRGERSATAATRLTFCTTGVLLRQLQSDARLSELTHVIVDEVHERSMQSDFLLVALRRLVRSRREAHDAWSGKGAPPPPPLKVILMSATVDEERLAACVLCFTASANCTPHPDCSSAACVLGTGAPFAQCSLARSLTAALLIPRHHLRRYFNNCAIVCASGRTFPVRIHYLEDVIEATGYACELDSHYTRRDVRKAHRDAARSTTVHVTGAGGHAHATTVEWDDAAVKGGNGIVHEGAHLDVALYSASTRRTVGRLDLRRTNNDLLVELLLALLPPTAMVGADFDYGHAHAKLVRPPETAVDGDVDDGGGAGAEDDSAEAVLIFMAGLSQVSFSNLPLHFVRILLTI